MIHTTLADVSDIIVLKIQDTLSVLNNSGRIRGQEVLDRLRETVLAEEGAGLAAAELAVDGVRGSEEGGFGRGLLSDCFEKGGGNFNI